MTISLARAYYADSAVEYDEDDIEVYSYGLQMFIAPFLSVLFVLVLGFCIGKFFETAAFLAAFISLRPSAGGYHAKTHLRCFSGLLVVYGLHLAVLYLTPATPVYQLSLLLLVVSTFPVLKYAPVADANKPIGPIQRKQLRKRSIEVFLIQAAIIAGMGIFGLVSSYVGIRIMEGIPYILLSFALGQLTASGSLVAAVIRNAICGESSACEQ
jgi:accessory gene regulator B